MQHQSEAIISLQTQLASVTQQADAPANPNKQQPALAYDDSKVDTCASHTAEDDAMLHDDTACAEQQAVPSNAGRKSGRESKGGKQGGVAWRTRWFTVRWSGGPHRFL